MPNPDAKHDHCSFELRFQSLHNADRVLAFPCDEAGGVNLDELSERSRLSYLFARTVIGHDFTRPAVVSLG